VTSQRRRVITRTVLFGLPVSLMLFLVFGFAHSGSVFYFLPFFLDPFAGFVVVLSFVVEISNARAVFLPPSLRPHVSFAFFLCVFSYVTTAFVFAASYAAALRLGGQILSAADRYVCITELEYGRLREFGTLLYYSLVTASTVGYGDFVPVGITARSLACFEVLEFWVLVLVSFTYFQLIANELRKRVKQQLATQGKNTKLYD